MTVQRGSTSVGSLLALVALLVMGAVAVPADANPTASDAFGDARAGVHPLAERVSAEGTVRVLVEVAASTAGGGTLAPAVTDRQQQRLAAAQERVSTALSEHAADAADRRARGPGHRYRHLPYLAVEVALDDLAALAATPGVIRIVEDEVWTPMLDASVEVVGADRAHAAGFDGGGSAVAVIDSGVDAGHPFLADRVVAEACFSHPGPYGIGLCPNDLPEQFGPGAAAPCEGFLNCDHGTHVAGIVAGAAWVGPGPGVAPGADIVAVQVSYAEPGGATGALTSDVLRALEWVYDQHEVHDIAAVNLSLGGGSVSAACDDNPLASAVDLLRSAGVVTVAATGNQGWTEAISAPACLSTVIAVGATTPEDEVAYFSNAHPELVDLLAPGELIASAVPGGAYQRWSGTSMATPHVAGAVALLRQQDPGASVETLVARLQEAAVPVSDTRTPSGHTFPRLALEELFPPSPLLVDGECTRAPFGDVADDHPFCGAIARGVEDGVLRGWSDGTFRPRQVVTRQAAMAFLYRLEGEPAVVGANDFVDIDSDHVFRDAITWGAQEGITEGWPDGTFRPTKPVSRQAAMAFLYRMAGEPEGATAQAEEPLPEEPGHDEPAGEQHGAAELVTFTDVAEGHDFHAAIAWGARTGITRGYDDGSFQPTRGVTRQAMAAFLDRR